MKRKVLMCAALLAALAMIGCAALPKQVADYGSVMARMDRVVVMPPAFSLEKAGMFSTEAQSEINHDISLALQDVMEQLVGESRYKLARLDVADQTLAANPELRQRLGENTTAINTAFQEILRTKGKVLDVKFGSNLDYFADASGAEYLLVVGGGGWFKGTGTRVAEFLLQNASQGSSTTLRAMLVDATRGNVIWYNEVTRPDMDPRKPSQLMKTSQSLVSPLLGKSRIVPDTSHDKDLIEKLKAQAKPVAGQD